MIVFMLAIKQNDAAYAYELASRPFDVKRPDSLPLNLKVYH